jgi:hypothetical protein
MGFLKNLFGSRIRRSKSLPASDSGISLVKMFSETTTFDSLIPPHARVPLTSPLENTAKQLAYLAALILTAGELTQSQKRVQFCLEAVKSDPSRTDMEQSLREEQKELAQRKSRLSDICDWLSASDVPAKTVAEAKTFIMQIGKNLAAQEGSKQMQIVIDRVFAIGGFVTIIGDVWSEISEWSNRKKE